MPEEERMILLQAAVNIIQMTHSVANDERTADYSWYFRNYVQWHSLAIVVAELGWSTNLDFANNAWAVLDPVLEGWDRMYKTKRHEPAWQHVNTLIERARHIRHQRGQLLAAQKQNSHKRTRTDISVPALQETPQFTPSTVPGQQHPRSSFSGSCTGTGSTKDFNLDFDPFSGIKHVDFNAFNEVFNDGSWDLLDNLEEVNLQIHDANTCGNWWNPPNVVPQAGGTY